MIQEKTLKDELNWFLTAVHNWCARCFGQMVAEDKIERNWRFFEEATELVQALGADEEDLHELIKYVYNRPKGDPFQEVGGVMITLGALCAANQIRLGDATLCEYNRINLPEIMEKIRRKQETKPHGTPLPGTLT